jgi:hypothetical protein
LHFNLVVALLVVPHLLILASAALSQDGSLRTKSSFYLTTLFPELTDLANSTSLTITFGWTGLSPRSPMRADYPLELRNDYFEGKGKFSVSGTNTIRPIAVQRELVQNFLVAVTRVKLWDEEYIPRLRSTDSYPFVGVTIQTKNGPLKVETRSQEKFVRYDAPRSDYYVDRVPWSVNYSGRTFVVYASDLDEAMGALDPHSQHEEVWRDLGK